MKFMGVLEIKNYSKSYSDGKKAADSISLTVEPGDIYGFIGHNGAGKSTTIRAIVGVLDFTEGEILIDGKSVKTDALECKKITAYIPDNPDIYTGLTGIQYLNLIADIYKVSEKERKENILKYSRMLEIEKDLNTMISNYSHGMRQKLVLISAFMHNPKLIVMDEPFVGLDPKASFTVKQIMKEFVENGGAIFFSTHVLEIAEKLCNKVAIIKDGQIVSSGRMEDILKDESLESVFLETSND